MSPTPEIDPSTETIPAASEYPSPSSRGNGNGSAQATKPIGTTQADDADPVDPTVRVEAVGSAASGGGASGGGASGSGASGSGAPASPAMTPVTTPAPAGTGSATGTVPEPTPVVAPGAATRPVVAAARQGGSRPTQRRVRLAVARVDPWSVMKLAFLFSVAIGIAAVVMTAMLWTILNSMGLFTSIDQIVRDQLSPTSPFYILDYVGFRRVVSLSVVIGVINVVLMTAIATLAAFLYNISSSLVGGVQLTLTDD